MSMSPSEYTRLRARASNLDEAGRRLRFGRV